MVFQELPLLIDPVAISIGSLSVRWYAIMWIVAFASIYGLLRYRIRRGESDLSIDTLDDLFFLCFLGAFIGGRLGYVIFYDLAFFIAHPLQIISPYDFSRGVWTGLYGMSFHGGLIGVVSALLFTARSYGRPLLSLSDFIVPAIPFGYFFGRVGNFLNGELAGRVSEVSWAMRFPGYDGLRHPSQLYEAFGEGVLLFAALWPLRNKSYFVHHPGLLSALYFLGYGAVRFVIEFFREPDTHLGYVVGVLTQGQVLSVAMVCCALLWIVVIHMKRN